MANRYDSVEAEIDLKYKKAKSLQLWFYNNANDNWLNPEEFRDTALMDLITEGKQCRTILDRYLMIDPKVGVERKFAAAERADVDFRKFAESVANYSWQ